MARFCWLHQYHPNPEGYVVHLGGKNLEVFLAKENLAAHF